MKKNIKHNFTHKDPEKTAKTQDKNKEKIVKEEIPEYVSKDLRRVLISCSIFSATIIGLYYINLKTEVLTPVFKFLGL